MKYILFFMISIFIWANSSDLHLVTLAYKNGLRPAPQNLKSLISILDLEEEAFSKEKIALGKQLFFEKNLSLNRDISCASCHSFDKGGADGITTAIGHENEENPFYLNTPTVLNTAFSRNFFWDGRSDTLQDQAKGPMKAPFEMSITPKLA